MFPLLHLPAREVIGAAVYLCICSSGNEQAKDLHIARTRTQKATAVLSFQSFEY